MEAFRALMSGALAPAGNPIVMVGPANHAAVVVAGFQPHFYDSGTSALAAALVHARQQRTEIKHPTVIIPGYCCPDLVSAAIYAGLRPVAVDICRDDASYDLCQLAQALDSNTVAVIAVNFLGVAERLEAIRELLDGKNIALVEDNAQWLPCVEYHSLADYVVFSFGRGKPLSLLGGGVLFSKLYDMQLPFEVAQPKNSGLIFYLKLTAYNLMLRPIGYGLVSKLKFLQLGKTAYKPKTTITRMDSQRQCLLGVNLQTYSVRSQASEIEISNVFTANNCVAYSALESHRKNRLLRYPVLCKSRAERDSLLASLKLLGASALYASPIDCVKGVSGLIDTPQPLNNAKQFADRLLTLPLHGYVREEHLSRIVSALHLFSSRSL